MNTKIKAKINKCILLFRKKSESGLLELISEIKGFKEKNWIEFNDYIGSLLIKEFDRAGKNKPGLKAMKQSAVADLVRETK